MLKHENFRVVFCAIESLTCKYERNTIYVWPTNTSWNDFKYKTHSTFVLHLENDKVVSGEALVSVLADDKPEYADYIGLGNRIRSNFDDTTFELPKDSFFTLLPSISHYRNLVRDIGIELVSNVLTALNDLVYTNENNRTAPWLEKAQSSDVFQKSFLRNSEPFFAYYNAADIIKGLDLEELDYVSNNLDLSFKLDGFSNNHDIRLRFRPSGLVPKRINVLIGENGLG